jgi:hypothetical protein
MKGDIEQKFPLIERILIIGVGKEDLAKYLCTPRALENLMNNTKDVKTQVLEEYKSIHIKESCNDNYIENIDMVIQIS